MRMIEKTVMGVACMTLSFGVAMAQEHHGDMHHDEPNAMMDHSADDEAIRAIIDAVEQGWEDGNGEPFRAHFLDWEGARYFESGGENTGLEDLVVNHVEPEKTAIPDLSLGISNLQIHYEGHDFAWAVADTTVSGTLTRSGETLDRTGKHTWIFRRVDGEWRVLHTHSSSRARR